MNLSESAVVDGTAEACIDAIADFDSYPAWQSAVKRVTVHTTDPQGRGKVVEFDIDLKVKTVNYSLDYDFTRPGIVSWTYAGGDIQDVTGSYTFAPAGGGVEATYALELELGFYVPGILKKKVQREAMKRSVLELKRRVEG